MPNTLRLEQDHEIGAPLRLSRWSWCSERRFDAPAGVHPRWELSWSDRGAVSYRVGRQRIDLAPGELIVVPAGVAHATSFAGDVSAASVKISDARLRAVLQALDSRARPRLAVLRGEQARRAATLGAMCLAEAPHAHGAALAIDALCEALLVNVLRLFAADDIVAKTATTTATSDGGRRVDPRVNAALEQIRGEYDRPLTVEALAKTAGMSRYHFSRAFKAQLGKSPYAYLTETRLQRAAAALRRQRDTPVTVAALDAGFGDLGRFARTFRRRFGVTPTAYRARYT